MNALIFKPTKNAMQSGTAKTKKWCLKLEHNNDRFIDPIMGWTGTTNTETSQIEMFFETREAAVAYAESNGVEYNVIEPKKGRRIIKMYADNYKFCPAEEENLN